MSRSLVVVAGVAFDKAGRTLMTKRLVTVRRPNMWEWPGGKVAVGETDAAALRREWQEELAVEIDVIRRIGACSFTFETSFSFHLYLVQLPPGATPQPLAAQALEWIRPLDAVQWRECVPSTFVLYPVVAALVPRAAALAAGASR